MKRIFLTLMLLLFVAGVSYAGELKKINLKQAGRNIIFYEYGGTQYRSIVPAETASVAAAVKVCLTGKFSYMQGNEIFFHDRALEKISFRLTPALEGEELLAGSNLWIGGRVVKDNEVPVFMVEAVSVLPKDIDLFRQRWNDLQQSAQVTPEDYFRLAWWLEQGKDLSANLTKQDFENYAQGIRQCYLQAISLDEGLLENEMEASLAPRLKRYQAFAAAGKKATAHGNEGWHIAEVTQFLEKNELLASDLQAGKISAEGKKRLTASILFFIGKLKERYLEDKRGALELYARGATLDPDNLSIKKELAGSGLVKFEGKWVKPEEKAAVLARRKMDAKKEKEEEARKLAEAEKRKKMRGLLEGKKSPLQIEIADELLATKEVNELAQRITPSDGGKDFEEDVCRYVLRQLVNLPPTVKTDVVLKAGLNNESPWVRRDAIDLLVAGMPKEFDKKLALILSSEKDEGVRMHLIKAMPHIKGNEAIDLLVAVMKNSALPENERKLASMILEKETGKTFGMDFFSWNQWWSSAKNKFERKH